MFSNQALKKLLIPLVIEQVLTSMIGIADTMMVSNLGAVAVSGVSLVDSINKLLLYLFAAMATGGTIICSQYLGKGDRESADRAARQVLFTSVVLSLAVMGLCLLLRNALLRLIFGKVEAAVMAAARTYFLYTAFSYPFLAVFHVGSALFRAGGNSRFPMLVSVGSNLLNILGNAFFMFVLKLGVAGAAVATTLSMAAAAVIMLVKLRQPRQPISVGKLRTIRPEPRMMLRVLSIGLPTGVENAMFQFGKLVVQSTVAVLGTTSIAANAIVVVVEYFTSMPSTAIGIGLMTVVGQCMGAGRLGEAKQNIRKLTLWAAVILAVVNWGSFFLVRPICALAGMDAASSSLAYDVMLVISIVKPILWPMSFVPAYGMKAAGDVRFGMLLSTASMWILRIGTAIILCRALGVGLIGIWCGYFADWAVRSIGFSLRYFRGKWSTMKVIES